MSINLNCIPWDRLLKEFAAFVPDGEESSFQGEPFVRSLASPSPPFVELFLDSRQRPGVARDEAVRDLYFFLLKKRYDEKLNLLHFAFLIFDDSSRLPREVVDRTPFPHEDGIPGFGDSSIFACHPTTGVQG